MQTSVGSGRESQHVDKLVDRPLSDPQPCGLRSAPVGASSSEAQTTVIIHLEPATEGAIDMTQRPLASGELPAPDVVAFIRYCHRRRGASWPELYDEMCGVAGRREFNGWDHAELEARGLTFSLLEMPRLAGWARAVLAGMAEQRETDGHRGSTTPRLEVQAAVA